MSSISNRRQPCTCTGSCRGPEGLGEGWVCCLTLPADERTPSSETKAAVTEEGFRDQMHFMARQAKMLSEEGNDVSSRVMSDAAKMVADCWLDREHYRQGMANWKATAGEKDVQLAAMTVAINAMNQSPSSAERETTHYTEYSKDFSDVTRVWLKAGTVVRVEGLPVRLVNETEAETNPGNLANINLEVADLGTTTPPSSTLATIPVPRVWLEKIAKEALNPLWVYREVNRLIAGNPAPAQQPTWRDVVSLIVRHSEEWGAEWPERGKLLARQMYDIADLAMRVGEISPSSATTASTDSDITPMEAAILINVARESTLHLPDEIYVKLVRRHKGEEPEDEEFFIRRSNEA